MTTIHCGQKKSLTFYWEGPNSTICGKALLGSVNEKREFWQIRRLPFTIKVYIEQFTSTAFVNGAKLGVKSKGKGLRVL